MTEYGQVINPDYDPRKNNVYEAFTDYFNNPLLTKIKNVNEYSMYLAKIHAMLGNAFRYLIVFVSEDINPVGHTQQLKDCEWISFQTRTLPDQHDLKSHTYRVEKKPPLDQKISVVTRSETHSKYSCETFPIEITLLHTRKNNTYQYQPTGTIVSALETFQTIIKFE